MPVAYGIHKLQVGENGTKEERLHKAVKLSENLH